MKASAAALSDAVSSRLITLETVGSNKHAADGRGSKESEVASKKMEKQRRSDWSKGTESTLVRDVSCRLSSRREGIMLESERVSSAWYLFAL